MSGAVIENVSNRKLTGILLALLAAQAAFFLVGAWYSPAPSTSMAFLMTRCEDASKGQNRQWFYIRPQGHCNVIGDVTEYEPHRASDDSFDLREIVFVAQMPHKRDGFELQYAPSQQFLLGMIQAEVEYSTVFKYVPSAKLLLEVRMGYADESGGEWKDLASSNVTRTLECHIDEDKKTPGADYHCDVMDLFELGSNNHPFYLINVRIPVDAAACEKGTTRSVPNCQLGLIRELSLIAIHQNGGFTQIWLGLKTFVTPFIVAAVYWYWNRITCLARKPLLLEKSILALGCSTAILDFPIEWISYYYPAPFLLLLSDIRQGLFYGVLFSFWLIFAGEHLIDDTTRNNIASYRFNLAFIATSSLALLVFELCERGMQLSDPFHSIWSTDNGTMIAYTSIYLASICTVIYFVFLIYKVWMVWTSIKQKRSAQLYRTCANRRLKVEMIIYRFKFLMIFTLTCAAFTIMSYTMQQHGEAQLHSDESSDQGLLTHSTSAFFTGTFGMWNIYVMLLLAMYAPSHKVYAGAQELVDEGECLMDGATESNPMTAFLKPATD